MSFTVVTNLSSLASDPGMKDIVMQGYYTLYSEHTTPRTCYHCIYTFTLFTLAFAPATHMHLLYSMMILSIVLM